MHRDLFNGREINLIRALVTDSWAEVRHLQHGFATLQDLAQQSSQSQGAQPAKE